MEEIIELNFCNACNRWTNHSLLFTHTFEHPAGDTIYYTSAQVWHCRGCDNYLYQTTFANTDDLDENGELILRKFFFPERAYMKISPKAFLTLPPNLNLLYNEIVMALNQNSYILASMGLRTLLEGICKEKDVTGSNLENKINNINFVSDSIKSNLHGIRFMGNVAAHELDSLSREEILIALEIMEDLMNYTYELDYKSSRILEIMKQKQLGKDITQIATE